MEDKKAAELHAAAEAAAAYAAAVAERARRIPWAVASSSGAGAGGRSRAGRGGGRGSGGGGGAGGTSAQYLNTPSGAALDNLRASRAGRIGVDPSLPPSSASLAAKLEGSKWWGGLVDPLNILNEALKRFRNPFGNLKRSKNIMKLFVPLRNGAPSSKSRSGTSPGAEAVEWQPRRRRRTTRADCYVVVTNQRSARTVHPRRPARPSSSRLCSSLRRHNNNNNENESRAE
jgi:hypothetical protein